MNRDGVQKMFAPDEMAIRRHPDGTFAGIRLGDVEVEVTDEFGVGHYSAQCIPMTP